MVDVDGVLVRPKSGRWDRNLKLDLGLSPENLGAEFFAKHWDEVVHGRAALDARLHPVLQQIAPNLPVRELINYWFRMDSELDLDLLAQLKTLKASGVGLQLATNQEHERAAYLWRDLGLGEVFSAIHYSAQLGWTKPSPEFYAAVVERTGFEPAELILLDDRMENVLAAREAGWHSHLWDGTERVSDLLLRTD